MTKDSFVALEDIKEDDWKIIEELYKKVLQTKVFGTNNVRASVAAFVLWISENNIGIMVDEPKKSGRSKRNHELH